MTDWQGQDKVDKAVAGAIAVLMVAGAILLVMGVWGMWR